MLHFAVFLVVFCLLHSFPVFYTCLRVTRIDITVAMFGHDSREAWIGFYISIQSIHLRIGRRILEMPSLVGNYHIS